MSGQRKPRILFVGAFPPPGKPVFGGVLTACRILMRSSLPEKLELDLIDSTQASNPPPPLFVRALFAVRKMTTFIIRFERRRPDATLLFLSTGASVAEKGAMAWYSRLRGVPALMFPRGGALIETCERSGFTRSWTRFAFHGAKKVLCQGTRWREFATGILGFSEANAPIIPNWTATRELLAIGRRRAAREPGRKVGLLFLGWLEREKGVFELLEACRRLMPGGRFSLELVGDGNAAAQAKEFVRRNGMGGTVNFHGWLQGEGLERILEEADVLVLPSWDEGLPNAMIEAMAAKLAIIATSVGNIPDVIVNEVTGLLVPERDPDALTAAISKVLDSSELRRRLAAAAHDAASAGFTVEAAVDLLVDAIFASIKEWERRGEACAA